MTPEQIRALAAQLYRDMLSQPNRQDIHLTTAKHVATVACSLAKIFAQTAANHVWGSSE